MRSDRFVEVIQKAQNYAQTFFPDDWEERFYSATMKVLGLAPEQVDALVYGSDTPVISMLGFQEDLEELMSEESEGDRLIRVLSEMKLPCTLEGQQLGPTFRRFRVYPGSGVKVNQIIRSARDLQVKMDLVCPPLIQAQPGYVSIDVPRKDRQIAWFHDYLPEERLDAIQGIKVPIGVNIDGQLIFMSLDELEQANFLAAGTTRSGKTEQLRSMLYGICKLYSPDDVEIVLIDLKGNKFSDLAGVPHLKCPIITEPSGMMERLAIEKTEMDDRYTYLKASNYQSFAHCAKNGGKKMKRTLIVIDEFDGFNRDDRAQMRTDCYYLAKMGGEAGVHLGLSIQRPDANLIPSEIRGNLAARVVMLCTTDRESALALGSEGMKDAAYLLGRGDLILRTVGGKFERLQGVLVNQEITELPRKKPAPVIDMDRHKWEHLQGLNSKTARFNYLVPGAKNGGSSRWNQAQVEYDRLKNLAIEKGWMEEVQLMEKRFGEAN